MRRSLRFHLPRSLGRRPLLRSVAAVLLTAALSLGVLAPCLGERMYQNGDLWNFLGGVVEARNALAEGQIPVRVAPHQLDGERYPLFQFYANLPFTVAAIILGEDGRNPYAAWKWTMFAALLTGGLCVYRLGWRWARNWPAAMSATAVFLSAPYLLTNLNDRGAVSEAIAICLLPPALLATWVCMTRPGLWRAGVCAVAWTTVGLTHNITYLYGATFLGLFVVSFVRPRRRWIPRIGRLALAGGLHLTMIAWYVAPQFALMPDLAIASNAEPPTASRALTPLHVLLAPVCTTPEASNVPRLGLQVGWLVLSGAVLGIVYSWPLKRSGRAGDCAIRSRVRRGISVRLAFAWTIALVAAWTPIDFWPFVPRLFYFVQFTYRLLGFALLFGAMLTVFAVARTRTIQIFGVVLLAAAITQIIYFPPAEYHPRGAHRWINDRPEVGGQGDYVVKPRDPAPLPAGVDLIPAEHFQAGRKTGSAPVFFVDLPGPSRLVLPVLWYPDVLEARVDGNVAWYGVSGKHVTVDIRAGRHVIAVRFTGLTWANRLSAAGVLVTLALFGWKVGQAIAGWRRTRSAGELCGGPVSQ